MSVRRRAMRAPTGCVPSLGRADFSGSSRTPTPTGFVHHRFACANLQGCSGGRGNPPLRVAFHRWACEKSDRARAHNARPYGLRFAPTRFAQPSYQEKTQTTPRLMQDVVVAYFSAAFACSVSAVKAAGSAIAISESILRLRSMPAFFRPLMNEE